MASINNITNGAIKEILAKVKAALKGKSDTTHTHTKSQVGLDKADNTADVDKSVASAAKLTTARTIGISGAASSTAQSFNGTANVSIPITGVSEAYLTWGGKHLSGTTSLIDSAMCEEMSANRLSFMPTKGITIEYSTDSGSTWTDYGASDAAKTELVTNTSGRTSFYMGKNATLSTNNRLRITISAKAASIYFKLRKALIYLSTSGSTLYVNIERSVIGTPTTFETLYSGVSVSGWSGWNSIALNGYAFGGGDTQTANTYAIRFTFYVTAVNTTYGNASISRIFMFGETMWSSNHSMQVSNRAYSIGNDKTATFTGNVVAPTFKGTLDGTAANATNVTQSAVTASGYTNWRPLVWGASNSGTEGFTPATTTGGVYVSDTLSCQPSSGTIKATTFKGALSGNATSATKATNDSNGQAITNYVKGISISGKTVTITKGDGTTSTQTTQDTDTTYSPATTSANGLMSSTDKSKLDGIAANANNYSLPTATSSVLGGVKTGSNITNSSGTISLTKANVIDALGYTPPQTDTTYSVATSSANGLMSSTDKSKLDSMSTPNTYSITLSSSGWSSSAPYTQSVAVNGITNTTKLIGMLDTRNCSSATVEKTMRKVYGYLTYFETGENTVTATAKFTKPTSDITITLEVI